LLTSFHLNAVFTVCTLLSTLKVLYEFPHTHLLFHCSLFKVQRLRFSQRFAVVFLPSFVALEYITII